MLMHIVAALAAYLVIGLFLAVAMFIVADRQRPGHDLRAGRFAAIALGWPLALLLPLAIAARQIGGR